MNSQVFKQYLTQMSFNQELVYHTAFVVREQCIFSLAPSSLQSQLSPCLHGEVSRNALHNLAGIAASQC